MGFSCCYDGDGAEVYRKTNPKAKKQHKCDECGHIIQPGEVYARTFTIYEGTPDTYIACERCDDLMEAFSDVGFCLSYDGFFGDYGEWLTDCGIEDGEERAFAIRAKHKHWSPNRTNSQGHE